MASLAELPVNMMAQESQTAYEDPWAEGGPYAPYIAQDQSRQATGYTTQESAFTHYQPSTINEHYFENAVTSQEAFSPMPAFSSTPRQQPYLETPRLVLDGPQDSRSVQKADLGAAHRVSPDPTSYPFEQRGLNQSSSASAASIASATSSNLGSPYHGALPLVQDPQSWSDPNPSIVQADGFDQDQYLPAGMELDMMFANDKLANGYVGECAGLPLSSTTEPPRSSLSSCVADASSFPCSSPSSLGTHAVSLPSSVAGQRPRYLSLDTTTIGEGPPTADVSASTQPSPFGVNPRGPLSRAARARSASAEPAVFRSPITPASASRSSPRSLSRKAGWARTAAGQTQSPTMLASQGPAPTSQPVVVLRSSPDATHELPPSTGSLSSFFSQSNGNFVPPLHNSCRFPNLPSCPCCCEFSSTT
jgi:hypothetical protein